MDRYGTAPRSFGATFWNPGFKTEKTAKKREKTGEKWARYGLRKRVRVADLFVMDRYVALTYDHRIVDGREAVGFLKHIKECVEDPRRLLLGL